VSRDTSLTSHLGPLLVLGLLVLVAGACGAPDVAITPPASVSPDFQSRVVGPDERVDLASGLSAVLPDHLEGSLIFGSGQADMYTEFLLIERDAVPARLEGVVLLTLENEARELPQLASFTETAELLAQGEHVTVLWGPSEGERWLMVVTRLPEHPTGVLWQQLSSAGDAAGARTEARELWRQFSIQGASLP
jgi:hypothetical protein